MAATRTIVISALLICITWKIAACSGMAGSRYFKANRQIRLDNRSLNDTITHNSDPSSSALHCALLCASPALTRCAIFMYHHTEATCVTSPALCTDDQYDLIAAEGARAFAMDNGAEFVLSCPSPAQPLNPNVDIYDHSTLGLIAQVSVGPRGVWGVTESLLAVHRQQTYTDPSAAGTVWTRDGHSRSLTLTYLDVGDKVCGASELMAYTKSLTNPDPLANQWDSIPLSIPRGTTLKSLTCSPSGHMWALISTGDLYKVHASGNVTRVGSNIKQMDAGHAGLWAVRSDASVWYRQGTYGDTGALGTDWLQVATGHLESVSSGTGVVVGVNSMNMLWRRDNITAANPRGLKWTRLALEMKQGETYGDKVWAVDHFGRVWQKPLWE